MHILLLNWKDTKNPTSGGAEIVTMDHAKSWTKAGHKVTLFTSSFFGAKNEEIIEKVHIVRKGSFITTYFYAPFFYLFSGEKVDVVVDEIHGIPYLTPLYVRKPKVAFIHEVANEIWDYMYPYPMNVTGKGIEKLYFYFYKRVLFWTDAESTINDLTKYGINRQNCTAISCAVTNKILNSLPKKEKKLTCIFVSRLVAMKGIEKVISAFSSINKDNPDAKLWIVGHGKLTYEKKLKSLVKTFGLEKNIIFWGKTSEKKKINLLQRAHILLHASVKEGWGLVVTEAASQATPAIVYDVAGLRDSVKHNKTGFVLSKNTPEELAHKTLQLFSQKERYTKMQKNCLKYAQSLTLQKSTQKSLELLKRATR